jgi:hypothetical protein
MAYPDCSEFNHSTTYENSFDGIFDDGAWKYALYSRQQRDFKDKRRGEIYLPARTS